MGVMVRAGSGHMLISKLTSWYWVRNEVASSGSLWGCAVTLKAFRDEAGGHLGLRMGHSVEGRPAQLKDDFLRMLLNLERVLYLMVS